MAIVEGGNAACLVAAVSVVVVVFTPEKLVLEKDPVYKYHKMCVRFFKITSFSLDKV